MPKILILVLIAYLLKRLGLFKEEDAKVFTNYVIYVALPVVAFKSSHSLGITKETVSIVLLAWLSISSCLALSYLLGKIFKLDSPTLRTFLLISSFGNTAFLGYPYTFHLFGEEGLSYAVIYDSLGSFIMVSTVGFLIARGSVDAKRILTFPPFLGLLLGFLLKDYPIDFLREFLDGVSLSLSPVILFALGLSLSFSGIRKYLKLSIFALVIKMGFSALITYLVAKALKLQGLALYVSVLESSMPSMVFAGILALRYGLNHELAFASVGLGIILSLIIFPLIVGFYPL